MDVADCPISAISDNLSPLVLDLGEKLTPRPTQVGIMGYPDHLNDRFGGALNKVDIAGQTDGQDIKVTELVSSDLNLKTVSHVLKSRRCQNKVDLIDKVGTKLAAFGQKDPTRSPMSPLVRRMQQNEKKWSDNFKKKRELSSLKKQKDRKRG